ncbi:cellulose biosynthesis cyclic di-GMP-binding regulatory protein BcsB [Pseudomonas cremoricolorata]|uniref:cellulose biosynthesis cyclic di-GMP-binding regulatory protein BcsB n=1 Tax=Pseudomonas cremoricolorata TaxID=157783 RepID=UPI000407E2D1|nr:cellulose biosynthesis cyclic di-GMP-binding regulatory protein BcsB [Pseudomonas cremoricolorata]
MSHTPSRFQLAILGTVLLASPFAWANPPASSPLSSALQTLAGEDWVSRSISLKDLGIANPIVLDQADNRQSFFLPVPRTVAISDAQLELNGQFIRGEELPATFRVGLDGQPRIAERVTRGEGDVNRKLPVDTGQHMSGFVRLSVDWSSPVSEEFCSPPRPTANILTLSPQTRLTYRFSLASLKTLSDAWSILPADPVILVAAGPLARESFDSAWRVGVALERNARRSKVQALPQVGDKVNLPNLEIPAALSNVPAFAALRSGSEHTLANAAELGALLMLDTPATRADLAIADSELVKQLNAAFDALGQQLNNDPAAAAVLQQWRKQRASLANAPLASQQVQLLSLGRQALIGVAADAGAKAAGVFDPQWRNVLVSPTAEVKEADTALRNAHDHLRLSTLGGDFGVFDVVSRGEWTATFPLSAVSVNGRMPGEFNLDVAAAPGASITKPVASIIWNNVLLNAAQLDADGTRERLSARIPGYALGVTNTVQVRFQRQPVSPNCAEVPQAYPVNVLPSSYLTSAKAEPDGTFLGLLPLLAGSPQVIVDAKALNNPVAPLGKLIRLANAAALSPLKAELVLHEGDGEVSPNQAFLAMDVKVAGAKPILGVAEVERLQAQGNDRLALDLQGPQPLGTLSVVDSGAQHGILWSTLGNPQMVPAEPFLLTKGNAVVIGEQGPLTWVDTTDPELDLTGTPFHQWRKQLVWALPTLAGIVLALLLLGILARRMRNKNKGH